MNKRMRNKAIRQLEAERDQALLKVQVLKKECEMLAVRRAGTPDADNPARRQLQHLREENRQLRKGAEQIQRMLDAWLAVLCRKFGAEDDAGRKMLYVGMAELSAALKAGGIYVSRDEASGNYLLTAEDIKYEEN